MDPEILGLRADDDDRGVVDIFMEELADPIHRDPNIGIVDNFIEEMANPIRRGLDIGIVENLVEELAHPIDLGLDQERNEEVVRNKNYFEDVIPNYTLEQFQDHFRMRRHSFEVGFILNCLPYEPV